MIVSERNQCWLATKNRTSPLELKGKTLLYGRTLAEGIRQNYQKLQKVQKQR
jgi:hypothetical protein